MGNGKTIKRTVLENIFLLAVGNTRGTGRMTKGTEQESNLGKMELPLKATTSSIRRVVMESSFMGMGIPLWENLKVVKDKAKE
jgi:hypothetical protein